MEEKKEEKIEVPETIPLLPVRDVVIFPSMILPLFVGRDMSIKAIDDSLSRDRLILLCAQKDVNTEDPKPEEIYSVGTVAMIMRMLKLPDGRAKILIQGLTKARILEYVQHAPTYYVKSQEIVEPSIPTPTLEMEALMRTVRELMERIISMGKMLPADLMMILENVTEPGRLADLVASNLGLKVEESQQILEMVDPIVRLKKVHEFLSREIEVLTVQAKIQSQAKEEIGKTQREYYLREQLRAIQSELGDVDEKTKELNEIREKITKAKMPSEVEREAIKQLGRLEFMHPDAAESSVIRTYLDWLIELPWSVSTKDTLEIRKAKNVLDEDHYDLEKVKERILEFLSVRKLKKKMKGPILCFVGPPGVGKTSLGKSIARALGRKFIRISLGGVRDEAEIRGHRRTYIGALPGRIIQGIKQAGTNNPIYMMDEIDKIGMDFRGDPSAALLEVLDPEQNHSFSDHYLGVPFDLSNVMFITTANLTDPIPSALKDRMEEIHLSGYTDVEKLRIAEQFLIPKQLGENGLKKHNLIITEEALKFIISQYTREAGLRNLEREISTICRRVARQIAEKRGKKFTVKKSNLHRWLGPPKYFPEAEQKLQEPGVATGLAWTQFGGEILHVEATIMKGKGRLTLTGQLGDVMKESAHAALSYARSRAADFNIDPNFFEKNDIHIHVPAGAIPKDGPSAGVTMAVALLSALKKTPVGRDVAMTGEITLRGRVLQVGGIKEKALGALRGKMNKVLLPEGNKKDLEEVPPYVKRTLKFVFAKHMDDVIKEVFGGKKAAFALFQGRRDAERL